MECGRKRLTPRTQALSGRTASVSKWTTWSSACTPVSVRPAQIVGVGFAGDRRQAALERVLDSASVRLGLPAREGGAVVLEAECDAHGKRRGSLPTRGTQFSICLMRSTAAERCSRVPSRITSSSNSRAPSFTPRSM